MPQVRGAAGRRRRGWLLLLLNRRRRQLKRLTARQFGAQLILNEPAARKTFFPGCRHFIPKAPSSNGVHYNPSLPNRRP